MKSVSVVFLFVLLAFIGCGSNNNSGGFKNIVTKEFQQKINEKNVVLLDVRTPQEIADGHIKGTTLFLDISNPDFEKNIISLDKTKTYLVYCRSGARSSRTASYMTNNGFENVYNLSGGILSWDGALEKP
jgi:rhodanese-related sulfurtransferase